MQVQYQLTADDFWQATLAWRAARPLRKWSLRILPIVCAVLAVLSVISILPNPQYRTSSPVVIAGIFLMVCAWARPRINARLRAGSLVPGFSQTGCIRLWVA